MNIATTPISTTDGRAALLPAALKPILTPTADEIKRQEAILAARRYHNGLHETRLTDRLKEFLGNDSDQFALRLNFIRKINRAVAERLIVEGFDSTAGDTDKPRQIEFAQATWDGSRMKGKRAKVLAETVRDGEYFIHIDYDRDNRRGNLTPWQRYTDSKVSVNGEYGDGEGMLMVYPNDDVDQKPLYAVQRWTETYYDATGTRKTQPRITLYYPNRIERYAQSGIGWQPADLQVGDEIRPAEQWWTDTKTEGGEPLGIPVVHIKSPELLPAALEAIPIQKGLNKTYVDMLMASDVEAFRLLFAFGWDAADADGNPLEITPGAIMGTTAEGASIQSIEGSDSTKFIEVIDKQIALMADVTDTPLSLINRSNQRAAEGTLQEEKESFIAKVRDYSETIEMALEDAFKIARRLHNLMNAQNKLDETAEFKIQWHPFWVRSVDDKAREAEALMASNVSEEYIWRKVWGIDEETIADMLQSDFADMRPTVVNNGTAN